MIRSAPILLLGAACVSGGCTVADRPAAHDPATSSDSGYQLVVMTSSPPLNLNSLQGLAASLRKNTRFKGDRTFGHAWLRLTSPERSIECGHTGDAGIEVESYEKSLARRLREGGPDPVACLWQPLNDGARQEGSGGFIPTLAAARELAAEEFEVIWRYVESYDFRCYSLRGPQCTSFVQGALECIGLYYDATIAIPVDQRQVFDGRHIQFWSDPQYRQLDIPMPHALEGKLRAAIDRGEFDDVTDHATAR
jgi:hypothetical protein